MDACACVCGCTSVTTQAFSCAHVYSVRAVCVCVKFPARVCLWGWCVTKRLVGCHFLLLELDCPALLQAEPRVDEPD